MFVKFIVTLTTFWKVGCCCRHKNWNGRSV